MTDQPIGQRCVSEYTLFCLGLSLATAGAVATAYAFGLAHAEIRELNMMDEPTRVR